MRAVCAHAGPVKRVRDAPGLRLGRRVYALPRVGARTCDETQSQVKYETKLNSIAQTRGQITALHINMSDVRPRLSIHTRHT